MRSLLATSLVLVLAAGAFLMPTAAACSPQASTLGCVQHMYGYQIRNVYRLADTYSAYGQQVGPYAMACPAPGAAAPALQAPQGPASDYAAAMQGHVQSWRTSAFAPNGPGPATAVLLLAGWTDTEAFFWALDAALLRALAGDGGALDVPADADAFWASVEGMGRGAEGGAACAVALPRPPL